MTAVCFDGEKVPQRKRIKTVEAESHRNNQLFRECPGKEGDLIRGAF
jgi:hypothetical protein